MNLVNDDYKNNCIVNNVQKFKEQFFMNDNKIYIGINNAMNNGD